jgi:hypothetical protein
MADNGKCLPFEQEIEWWRECATTHNEAVGLVVFTNFLFGNSGLINPSGVVL